jgi:hypothetical protein
MALAYEEKVMFSDAIFVSAANESQQAEYDRMTMVASDLMY